MAGLPRGRRSRVEIMAEVLRQLHYARKRGEIATAYMVEKRAGLQGRRLRQLLRDLRRMELVDGELGLTKRGYAFLEEYTSRILPFLERFALRCQGFHEVES